MFYALCRGIDSFVGLGKNAPKKSPAKMACRGRAAMLCRPSLFGRYAPSSLRPAKHRKTSRLRIYRRDVALTFTEWDQAFPANRLLAAATLDRLRHNAYCLTLDGDSYRSPKMAPTAPKSAPQKQVKSTPV